MSQPPGEVVSYCYRHPHREALVRCTRCDRPICPDCMRQASVGFHCPDDVAREARTIRPTRTSVGARIARSTPYATFALIALNVVVYALTVSAKGATLNDPGGGAADGKGIFFNWQLLPYFVKTDDEYYRLITSAFLHGSLLHIASNMLALFFVGPAVESVLGRWRFLAVYLLSALGGSTAIYVLGNATEATVGASGAIFGLFGACLVLYRQLRIDLQWLISIVVLNFAITFSVHGISKLGHVGGFVTGLLAGAAIGGLPSLRARVPARLQVAGLGALAVLIVLAVGLRTATW
jgi:membrane associated rhomboid family serine protease